MLPAPRSRGSLVLGCELRNTAFADPGIPDKSIGQKPWQRHTYRFGAAIDAKSSENLLIANNRLPKSGDDDFKMNGYVVQITEKNEKKPFEIDGVPFDYDQPPFPALRSGPTAVSGATRQKQIPAMRLVKG